MKHAKFGPLSCHVRGGTDGQGSGDGPVMVLCHGFGAPGTDLVDLWRVIEAPKGTRFVFPEAPLALGGPYGPGRAWWHIDMAAIELAMMTGRLRDFAGERPAGLDEARDALAACIDEIMSTLAPRDGALIIGGFSQGAMVTTELALKEPTRKLNGLVLLSGTLLCRDVWVPQMTARAGLPVFQSHGTEDPILPFGLAQELAQHLQQAGAKIELHAFRGPHTIPMGVLERLSVFCGAVLGR